MMCDTCGCGITSQKREVVSLNESLLRENERIAQKNLEHFNNLRALALNLISSPGAGKTTLLEKTFEYMPKALKFAVIEGDIETERDAERIREKGVHAIQITTGGACHLDANLIHSAIHSLSHKFKEDGLDMVFIENVGNLVCPATFYLGEHKRVVMLSVPEGSDKPAKYPKAFLTSDIFVITKVDLLPYFDFSMEEARELALSINPNLKIFELSAISGKGMKEWIDFLLGLLEKGKD